jgi:NCS2 family nucleobase:cation symporter-2
VTSRVVGLGAAALCLLLALFPRATALLAQVPVPVIAATLLYAGGLMLVNGMQLAASRLLDMRKTVAVGLGVATALTMETAPQVAGWAPEGLRPLLTATALGTIVAIALNALLRIGVRQQVSLSIPAAETGGASLWDFVMSAGASWGARADVVSRVATAIAWCGDALAAADLARGDLTVTVGFDEHRIDVRIAYAGQPILLSASAPTAQELMDDETAAARLAGHMVRRLADRLSVRERGGTTELRFSMDH